ncbi:hypothetical protein PVL29_022542 [Vitis rotundifolia]|uniref:Pentatricopeptide repeat-containing protein n=1 Tax=Vitis rotundifolia TaxID=103349 RepID=A0AA38YW98_VITRO|nr:hypothetical protein PVL29_022542 [Vitis rotundifolia]
MQRWGLCPITFALSSALKACDRIVYRMGVLSIHGQVQKFGFCGGGDRIYMETALVDYDCKLGDMEISRKMFDEMAERNVVSWNSMLDGYLKSGDLAVGQRMFDEIPQKDVISSGDLEKASSLFQQMPERNFASWNAMINGYLFFDAMPQRNSVSWMTMISGYSKCGDVDSACELFDQVSGKDLLLFNAVIACYAQNSKLKEALKLFNMMLRPNVNVRPDEMTLASCGSIDKAYELFHGLRKKDLVAYTAMILGCGINGKAIDAIKLFDEMVDAQICPNLIMFTGLLTTYNHAGLVEEGYHCFTTMKKYNLVHLVDHYGIMVDLFGRAGWLQEALELIKSMPMQPHAGVWGALLFACRLHNNADLGEIAAQHFFELEPDTTGCCSLPCNIYVFGERLDDVRRLRKIRKEKAFSKYLVAVGWNPLDSLLIRNMHSQNSVSAPFWVQ